MAEQWCSQGKMWAKKKGTLKSEKVTSNLLRCFYLEKNSKLIADCFLFKDNRRTHDCCTQSYHILTSSCGWRTDSPCFPLRDLSSSSFFPSWRLLAWRQLASAAVVMIDSPWPASMKTSELWRDRCRRCRNHACSVARLLAQTGNHTLVWPGDWWRQKKVNLSQTVSVLNNVWSFTRRFSFVQWTVHRRCCLRHLLFSMKVINTAGHFQPTQISYLQLCRLDIFLRIPQDLTSCFFH